VDGIFDKMGLGYIESTPGASGGVMFIPTVKKEDKDRILKEICEELSQPGRLLHGGFLYNADIINDPSIVTSLGKMLTTKFFNSSIDYVITVETKGIPLAYSTAHHMNVPLVVVRHSIDVSDGAFVSINYLSGSSSKIQSMALPTKALKRNSRLLFIDDYMKAGGTAKGVIDLAREFDCRVAGIGVFIETASPEDKLVDEYFSLLTVDYNSTNKDKAVVLPTENN
jgi:purine operon repressor